MTDTRITVDVSTEALLQRARQQQAQSRQAAIQREEERKGVERQKREARKAGRNQPPGQDRLKGRSKLRGMAPRHEVAAGYVQQYVLAQAFWQVIQLDRSSALSAYEDTVTHKIWCQDGQSSITLKTVAGLEEDGRIYNWRSAFFPSGRQSLVGLFYNYYPAYQPQPGVLVKAAMIGQPECFYADRSHVRVVGKRPITDIDALLVASTFMATPNTIRVALRSEETAGDPFNLVLTGDYYKNTVTGKIYALSPASGSGKPAPWASKSYRVANEDSVRLISETFTPPDFDGYQLGSAPFLAWDWGKPDLCRRLLLQLGFRSEDLRP